MIVLSGAHLVLPDRILSPGTVAVDGDRIVALHDGAPRDAAAGARGRPLRGCYIVPGFIDVHVHGVDGVDALDEGAAVARMAACLPRYGVTAFCPTTTACAPDDLRRVLRQVRSTRAVRDPVAARVLPAHLESNFIHPEFRGAQPLACLRSPLDGLAEQPGQAGGLPPAHDVGGQFAAGDILHAIECAGSDVGIVTMAPELDGGLDLVRWLVSRGHRVSLGHSAADYEQARDAIAAGASQATHLFNRMRPLGHRAPGLVGAVLESTHVAAEVICDGYHVHPALVRMAVAVKGVDHILAVTDGTSLAGRHAPQRGRLGGLAITAGGPTAVLADGTTAGGTSTMDQVFRMLVGRVGLSMPAAAAVTAATPARQLGLAGHGVLAVGAVADLVVLDETLAVVETYIAGRLVYAREATLA